MHLLMWLNYMYQLQSVIFKWFLIPLQIDSRLDNLIALPPGGHQKHWCVIKKKNGC